MTVAANKKDKFRLKENRENLIAAVYYYFSHPVEFVEDVIHATPDKTQSDILNAVADNKMTSVRSGHGIGKTAVEAWIIIWFMFTRPYCKVPCTAPTFHQLMDILWAEVAKWLRNSPELKDYFVWTAQKLYVKGHPEEWYCVPRTATQPDALQGFHADCLLFIIDEASGVDDKIFEPVLGALSTDDSKLLMCGNPTKTEGFFYESHTRNRELYCCIRADCRYSSRVSHEYIENIIRMFGEDSDQFRVRVAGEFPRNTADAFIPFELVENSALAKKPKITKALRIDIGCDVARFGDDSTIIGYKVNTVVKFFKKISGQDLMTTADNIIVLGEALIKKFKYKQQIAVKVDDSGLGGGVTDRLNQMKKANPKKLWWLVVVPVIFGMPLQKNAYYHDTTTYMMSVVRDLLSNKDENGNEKGMELHLPDDGALISQLSSRKYALTDRSKLKVESKDEYKKRNKNKSPDEADCVLLLCLPYFIEPIKRSE